MVAGSRRLPGVVDVPWWLLVGACLAAGLVVVLSTFCLAVSLKRRRQPRSDLTTTPTTASLSRRKTHAPPPLALMTDMDPLTSAILRRHQFDDVTVLEQPPGTRTAGECGNYISYMQSTAGCKSAPVCKSTVAVNRVLSRSLCFSYDIVISIKL